jgi:hypothetical protein
VRQQTSDVTVTATTGRAWRVDHWFYIGVGLTVITLSVAGFVPSIVNDSGRNAPLTLLVSAHGIVAAGWLLLFLTQATLVATGRTAVHRRVGIISAVLAAVFVVLGYSVTVATFRRGFDLSGDMGGRPDAPFGAAVVLFPLALFLTFGILVAAALWYRHRPDIHKRLMVLALVSPLASESVNHLIGHWLQPSFAARNLVALPIVLLLMSASAVHDRVSHGRIHPVSLWVPLLLAAVPPVLAFVVLPSATWRDLAAWLIH